MNIVQHQNHFFNTRAQKNIRQRNVHCKKYGQFTFQTKNNVPFDVKHSTLQCRASVQDLETAVYLTGKSITLFTMFYCSLNWWHYRSQRKQQERENNDRD